MELVGVSIRLETEIDGQRILFLMIPNPFIICQRDLIQGKNARSEFQKQRDTGGEMSEIRPSVISFDCYFGIRNFPFITNPGRLTVKQPTMYCPGLPTNVMWHCRKGDKQHPGIQHATSTH